MSAEPIQARPQPTLAPPVNRITVTSQITLQQGTDEPSVTQMAWWQKVDSEEEAYSRRIKIDHPGLAPLDTGWIGSPGLIVVQNLEPIGSDKVIEINGGWLIYPGQGHVGQMGPETVLLVKTNGPTQIRIKVHPR